MPIMKLGDNYYKGEQKPIFLIQGVAVKDAEERPVNGMPHSRVAVSIGHDADGNSLYITVNGWRDRSNDVSVVRKMDSIIAVGRMDTRMYGDKEYQDLDADFICVSGGRPRKHSRDTGRPAVPIEEFVPVDEEEAGNLPF